MSIGACLSHFSTQDGRSGAGEVPFGRPVTHSLPTPPRPPTCTARPWQKHTTPGSSREGSVLATKAVEKHGKGSVSAAKAVETQGKGSVLATKAVETQNTVNTVF